MGEAKGRVQTGAVAGMVPRAEGQKGGPLASRHARRGGVRSPAVVGASDSEGRILDSPVGRRHAPAARGAKVGDNGAGEDALPGDTEGHAGVAGG